MTTGHFGCPWCHLWDKWWECIGCASAFEWIFFDIPQAKNHQSHHWCQDQGEVLSCWHHSRFLGPFGSCVQLVPTLLASQRHVADFLHGQKSVRRGFSSCYKHGFQNQLLSCVGAMISARMRKKLLMGVGGRGGGSLRAEEVLRMNTLCQNLFLCFITARLWGDMTLPAQKCHKSMHRVCGG